MGLRGCWVSERGRNASLYMDCMSIYSVVAFMSTTNMKGNAIPCTVVPRVNTKWSPLSRFFDGVHSTLPHELVVYQDETVFFTKRR
jgi:hypothetical protein